MKTLSSYIFAALSGIFFISGIGVLVGGEGSHV